MGAAGLAGALAAGGCDSATSLRTFYKRARADPVDARLLNRLLAAEYHAIAAYTAATPLLTGVAQAASKQFLGQEVLHADRLISLIQHAGGQAEKPQASYDLGQPHTPREVIRLLLAVEQLQLMRYVQLAPQLSTGQLKATTASILASQAQHSAVWRLQLGQLPAPGAFVTGHV
jgi:bacterioferritin (cytochrome b1)